MMQLPDYFLEAIPATDNDELEALYVKFCQEKNLTDLVDFARFLYLKDIISSDELKRVQSQRKIEFTAFANQFVDDTDESNQAADAADAKDGLTILESIDEGAMGEILIAKDNELGRIVAYKKIHPHISKYPDFMKRFFMEAQVTAQLQHPNIIPVHNMVELEDGVGYTMKLIQGKTLKALIEEAKTQLDKKGRVDERHTLVALLDHFLKVCDALHYAHRKGVVHRDLKPLNIMIGPYNEVYVMDWGIAKLVDVDKSTFADKTERVDSTNRDKKKDPGTSVGELLGTPVYMSPEQANGLNDVIDHRSDLFTLGIILYELITLKRALAGASQQETLQRARAANLHDPVPYSNKLHVPSQLMAIVKKATQFDADDRYDTVEEFADDIRRYLHGEAVTARPDKLKHKVLRWMNQHRVATLNLVIYSILASVVIVGWSVYEQQKTSMEAHAQSQRIGHFITAVSKQAQSIDTEFLKYEGILQGVAASAVTLLDRAQADPERFYDYKDFADPQLAPPDLAESSVYGFPVSVGWHAYKLAPGVSYDDVENIVRILNPMRHTFKRMILKSHHTPIAIDSEQTASLVIREQGLPLVWTYVGLEQGIFAEYPGKTGYPADFDPRKRPWYVSTLQNEGACWMPPYIDVGGRGVLLPCTSKLFSNTGEFLGVAAVEMTLDYIRNELMSISEIKGVENTYLLNGQAAIVVDSSETSKSYERGTLINSIDDLRTYPHPDIVEKIKLKESGYLDYSEGGRDKILAYHRLNSIGWYYIAEAYSEEVEKAAPE